MKTVILHPNEGVTKDELMTMARAGHFALQHEDSKQPGDTMAVTMNEDMSKTYGVKFNRSSIAVWPPGVPTADPLDTDADNTK